MAPAMEYSRGRAEVVAAWFAQKTNRQGIGVTTALPRVTNGCGCLGLWLEVWNQKMEHKGVREDLTAAGLARDPAGRSLGLGELPGRPWQQQASKDAGRAMARETEC